MSVDRPPLVTVVVLSYNRPNLLTKALESIARQTYSNLEVIVVDNPSPKSHEIREIVAKYSSFRLIAMKTNHGYAGGVNEGIREATGDYIYVTEDDMVSDSGAITALVEHMESDPLAGLATGVIDDDRGSTIYAGGFVKLGAVYRQYLFGRDTPVLPTIEGPFCVTYASGAQMMFRRAAIEELGAFREDFFMYYEDVEICARFQKAEWAIVVVPAARSITLGEGPEKTYSQRVAFHKVKNLMATSLLHIAPREIPEFLCRYGALNLLHSFVHDRNAILPLLAADLWIAVNLPRLMWDRRRFAHRQQERERQLCSVGAHSV